MKETPSWQGLPYYPISQFYKRKFGEKVYKVPVSLAQTCPNREGLKNMKTCNFCDIWGSAAYPELRDLNLKEQLKTTKEKIRKRFKAHRFLVYFQSYTNTFQKVAHLKQAFEVTRTDPEVEGFIVGSRPDCISDAVIDLWNEYLDQGYFVAVEMGVQSFNEEQLLWMRRGHTAQASIKAISKIKSKSNVDLGIHLMFGLKDETDQQIIETAHICNDLPINNVKLHNLHILKNTPLAEDYFAGNFKPIHRDSYRDKVILFLQHLDSRLAVHRLAAVASRHSELVAPEWAKSKLESYQYILEAMIERQAYQGQRHSRLNKKKLRQYML